MNIICRQCGVEKELTKENFYVGETCANGFDPKCKTCRQENAKTNLAKKNTVASIKNIAPRKKTLLTEETFGLVKSLLKRGKKTKEVMDAADVSRSMVGYIKNEPTFASYKAMRTEERKRRAIKELQITPMQTELNLDAQADKNVKQQDCLAIAVNVKQDDAYVLVGFMGNLEIKLNKIIELLTARN